MSRARYLKGACQHCGGHLEFPVESVGLSADCPHCGQATELLLLPPPEESAVPRKAIGWTIAAVVILALGLGAALVALQRAQRWAEQRKHKTAMTAPADPTNSPVADAATEAGFDVSAIALEKAQGTSLVYATGTVKNGANQKKFGVRIELDLLDATGKKIGTAKDYQAVLEPGAEWRFKALVVDAKAASAKLASIREDQ